MIALIRLLFAMLVSPFKSRSRLEAENAALRQQLIVLRRKAKGRAKLTNGDRWFFVQLYRLFPSVLGVFSLIRPETVSRWHRAGFGSCWRWKSRRGGRPQVHSEPRELIRRMSLENPLWGAPRIHGELLKLGSKWRSRRWLNIWPNGTAHPVRDGAHFCAITRLTSPRWICSSFRPSASNCSTPLSSFACIAGTWLGPHDQFYDLRDAIASARSAKRSNPMSIVVIADVRTGKLVFEIDD